MWFEPEKNCFGNSQKKTTDTGPTWDRNLKTTRIDTHAVTCLWKVSLAAHVFAGLEACGAMPRKHSDFPDFPIVAKTSAAATPCFQRSLTKSVRIYANLRCPEIRSQRLRKTVLSSICSCPQPRERPTWSTRVLNPLGNYVFLIVIDSHSMS